MATANRIVTPEAVASFPSLITPRKVNEDSKEKYGITLLFYPDKEQKYLPGEADLTDLRTAAMEVAKEKFGSKLPGLLKAGKFKTPFLDDEDTVEKYGWPAGTVFLRCSSMRKPGVVSRHPDADGRPAIMTDEEVEEKIFPGARVRASLRPYAYDTAGNRGVSFDLQNVQWLGEDERIDGRADARDEFEPTEDAADLEATDAEESDDEEATPPKTPGKPRKAAKAKDVDLTDML